jgi:L-ascorbate metabolism protein UlaG (beta-lactamase superfamily)
MAALIDHIRRTPIIPNSLAIWSLGQMGVILKGPDAVLYIDPCLTDIVREQFGAFFTRAYPPPVEPSEVTNADYYLISHEHLDHLDTRTAGLVAKASPKAKFVTTRWCRDLLANLDIGDDRTIFPAALQPMTLPNTSAKLTALPAAHYDKEYSEDKGYRWYGFLIEWNGVTFYHGGDTIIYPGYIDMMKSLPTPDVAWVAVNGRDYFREADNVVGNFLPVEAARLAGDLGWGVLIPGHNDLYPANTIPLSSIVEALAAVAPRQKYKMLQSGELYYFVK